MNQQPETTQHLDEGEQSAHDILSIIDEQYCDQLLEFPKYATVSPLKKPTLDIPTPPDKLLPRKLF